MKTSSMQPSDKKKALSMLQMIEPVIICARNKVFFFHSGKKWCKSVVSSSLL